MASTLVLRLTNAATPSTPGISLGGIMSANAVSSTALNNIYDDVSPAERISGIPKEYRAIDVYNSGDATAEAVQIYMSVDTASTYTVLHIGHDATNNPHVSGWNGELLATDTTDPASPVITFAARTSASKLALPNIPAGSACRVFFKRIVTEEAVNMANDLGTVTVEYA